MHLALRRENRQEAAWLLARAGGHASPRARLVVLGAGARLHSAQGRLELRALRHRHLRARLHRDCSATDAPPLPW